MARNFFANLINQIQAIVNQINKTVQLLWNVLHSPGGPLFTPAPPLPHSPPGGPPAPPPDCPEDCAIQAPPAGNSADTPFSPVDPQQAPNYGSGGSASPDFISQLLSAAQPDAAGVKPELMTVQPVAPPDPQMMFLDGLGDTLVSMDMTTLSVLSQVVVPSTTGPFGIRPNGTGSPTEVWVANGAMGVSVANLSSQSVAANIPTPSIPSSATPAEIVFTPGGTTAFEAFRYASPDSSGNNGALVVFDAVGRAVSSTLPLTNPPTALLMAPDGSTAYILSSTGTLTYYDDLSGTADLTVSTVAPGSEWGYPGTSSVAAIHPDGTRLFWNVGVYLVTFDLTAGTVTNVFNSGLPATVGRTFSLSQDGRKAYFSDQQGDVAILDTLYGYQVVTFNTGTATSVFGGPPVAP